MTKPGRRGTSPAPPRKARTSASPAVFGAIAVAVAALGAGVFLVAGGSDSETPLANLPAGVRVFEDLSDDHVEGDVDYPQAPPVGGPHASRWQNCGFYAEPVPEEQAVHSLEHGAVWLTHRPDLASEQVDALRQLAATHAYVIVSPYPDLPSPVVASAWGVQLRLDSTADPGLEEFVGRFERGDQAPEPRGPCSGGAGTPE